MECQGGGKGGKEGMHIERLERQVQKNERERKLKEKGIDDSEVGHGRRMK